MLQAITKPNLNCPLHRLSARGRFSGSHGVDRDHVRTWKKSSKVNRAVMSRDHEKIVDKSAPAAPMVAGEVDHGNGSALSAEGSKWVKVKAEVTIRKKIKERLSDIMEEQWSGFVSNFGHGVLIQLISEDIDPVTKSGRTVESYVRGWSSKPSSEHPHSVNYDASFVVPYDFGNPGAVLITNFQDKEFYLVEIALYWFDGELIYFPARSWIHPRNDNPESRIIFRNQAYLPSETPPGIKDLRHEDLLSLRGNGKGERKMHERIYDYAPYNDLGNPDKDPELDRPVLAGEKRPYPRRCRTGRPPMETDPECESRIEKPNPVYVPRDEAFEEIKKGTFSAGRLKAVLHNLIPQIAATLSSSDNSFNCFSDIDRIYNDGIVLKDEEQLEKVRNRSLDRFAKQVLKIGDKLLKYDVPDVIKRDKFAWLRDNEFARQALAGVNPVNIELLKSSIMPAGLSNS
ncbi:hypothetical protein Droror1_Dr00008065 [Drosera rotundifolia]